ncbi:MAG: ornithine carbamoyltransferase [Candidatus Aenigmarchaeota archaeon]|nr:ornithine carbamoyltransferase [Candidatus Aenigmarchaeota archaeon]
MKKDFLTLDDIKRSKMLEIFELASKLKKKPFSKVLANKSFVLLFFKHSTRTRLSFEIGIEQLGGNSFYVDGEKTQMFRSETPEDTANSIERYVDCLIVRLYSHITLQRISSNLDKPVINALSDLSHPCQILSDLFTIREVFKDLKGLKLAYIGDGNNVCNSLLLGCSKMGMDITVACPQGYEPNEEMIKIAKGYSQITKSKIEIVIDPEKAVKNANVVYTDAFYSMGQEEEKEKRMKVFLPKYQVNLELMEKAEPGAIFMHCLPAHRENEVTSELLDSNRSVVFDQAENRLHVQKALLIKILGLDKVYPILS